MNSPVWPLGRLEALLDNQEPSVQKWAVSKLFHLHTGEARRLLPGLLEDKRPAVVSEAMEHVGKEPSEDVIRILGKLYLTGPESISSKAMSILGDVHYLGAVDWMKERILKQEPLSAEQVISMIQALGHVPSDDAYSLLKQTEKAFQEKESGRWEMFYASLLQHRRAEDIATLLRVAMDEDEDRERYRQALGLLLGEVDPGLNPSNVFFVNPASVRKHWLKRLEDMERGIIGEKPVAAFERLKAVANLVNAELDGEALEALRCLAPELELEGTSPFAESIWRQALERLHEGAVTEGKRFAFGCLALSAMMDAFEDKICPPPPADATCKEKVGYLLRNRPPRRIDETLMSDVLKSEDRMSLVPLLISALDEDPRSWGALRAVELLGRLRAEEALEEIIGAFRRAGDNLFSGVVRTALIRMGIASVSHMIPLLESSDPAEVTLALKIMGLLPTSEGIDALLSRFNSLHAKH